MGATSASSCCGLSKSPDADVGLVGLVGLCAAAARGTSMTNASSNRFMALDMILPPDSLPSRQRASDEKGHSFCGIEAEKRIKLRPREKPITSTVTHCKKGNRHDLSLRPSETTEPFS